MSGIGQNLGFYTYYIQSDQTVDITHGAQFLTVGGTYDNQPVPDAFRDSEGYPVALPTGATAISLSLGTPETTASRSLTWSTGGTGTGQMNVISSTVGISTGLHSSGISFSPSAMPGTINNYIHYAPAGDGSYPKRFVCRPVADPGGTWTANFINALKGLNNATTRVLHQTGTEYNCGVTTDNIKFPQDGDGQLTWPVLKATYRNTSTSGDWFSSGAGYAYRDGLPVEMCVSLATSAGTDLWYPVHWNYDGTAADGTFTSSTYLNAIAPIFAQFPLTTGKKVYIQVGNENWGGETDRLYNQAVNEGNYRGQGADCLPACVCVATSNITLSGTQTIDGVAVTGGQRVLVAGQTNASQNGPYVCAAGAWSRAADVVASNSKWFISGGTSWANTTRYVTNAGTITLGTTNLTIPQFERFAREAEKSVQVFAAFEAAWAAAGAPSSTLVRVLASQDVSPAVGLITMLANPATIGHVDALSAAPYYDATAVGCPANYSGSYETYYQYMRNAVDYTLGLYAATYNLAIANGFKATMYEAGPGSGLTNSTFIAAWATQPRNHDAVCYYLNEIRRRFPLLSDLNWHDFIDGQNGTVPTSSEDWGILHHVTDYATMSLATTPKAQAIYEAINGNYTMLDPTVNVQSINTNTPVGTVAALVPGNGVLPEATLSVDDARFAISGGNIVTAASLAQGNYTFNLIQTPNAGVSVTNGPTHSTSVTVTVAQGIKTLALETVGAGSWTLPSDVDVTQPLLVYAWGGGAGAGRKTNGTGSGGSSSAGGGAFASTSLNISSLTAGTSSIFYNVGASGVGATTSGGNGTAGGDTWLNMATNAAPTVATDGVLAKGGGLFGNAGSGSASVGTTKNSGGAGAGGSSTFGAGGQGGGAGGTDQSAGVNVNAGAAPANLAGGGGAGGGGTGASGGTATASTTSDGTAGGTDYSGNPGGTAGTSGTAGGAGANGSGGGGGSGTSTPSTVAPAGGNGGAGTHYLLSGGGSRGGGGGGGGAGGTSQTGGTGGAGGNGGNYGGGGATGGSGATSGNGGNGGQGGIVITYTAT